VPIPNDLTKLTKFGADRMLVLMTTITTHDAKTHLSRYLADVEKGKEFIIARGKSAVAMLVPVRDPKQKPRPKVGRIKGPPFKFQTSALAPLTKRELAEWGL
jgi:antitoxin (DNA-binding transcriptional repressor) of toxin-antitoxin stability system